jgi:hypothetical protein
LFLAFLDEFELYLFLLPLDTQLGKPLSIPVLLTIGGDLPLSDAVMHILQFSALALQQQVHFFDFLLQHTHLLLLFLDNSPNFQENLSSLLDFLLSLQ